MGMRTWEKANSLDADLTHYHSLMDDSRIREPEAGVEFGDKLLHPSSFPRAEGLSW